MTPRARIAALVTAAAGLAAVVTVGATVLSSSNEERPQPQPAGPRAGVPPVLLDLGVRGDPEAVALRRAAELYRRGRRREAGTVFARYDSPAAQVGAAVAAWPEGTVDRLERLARRHPRSALVRLHLGLARFWARRDAGAVAAWREAVRVEPDSLSAVRAGDLLHPNFPRGLPIFVPSFGPPASFARLRPDRQLAALERGARTGAVRSRLLYGVALQRLGKPVSAERQYAAAAAADSDDAEAQVAAAVGRFDKADPSRAFSRLGPLTRRFPRSPSVRFHLGLLLLWIGDVDDGKRQLRRAQALGPRSPLGREANRFLARLEGVRTSRARK
jgi:tetratricopeptide (TPR) repeat protein